MDLFIASAPLSLEADFDCAHEYRNVCQHTMLGFWGALEGERSGIGNGEGSQLLEMCVQYV
jgi:hypothetical protein